MLYQGADRRNGPLGLVITTIVAPNLPNDNLHNVLKLIRERAVARKPVSAPWLRDGAKRRWTHRDGCQQTGEPHQQNLSTPQLVPTCVLEGEVRRGDHIKKTCHHRSLVEQTSNKDVTNFPRTNSGLMTDSVRLPLDVCCLPDKKDSSELLSWRSTVIQHRDRTLPFWARVRSKDNTFQLMNSSFATM